MSEQSRQESTCRLQSRHIASLTHSEMIMLNLQQLQRMGRFAYEVVLSDEDERKIYAYEYEGSRDCYLLMVPACFYTSTKNKCRMFVEMLLLCSQTISLPLGGDYSQEVGQLLNLFCLKSRHKKGKSILKIYLANECWVTYLDFVTFQAIQFKGKSCKQLIAMKKSNSYQYCFNYFKDEVLPSIFTSSGDEHIEDMLQTGLTQIRTVYDQLCCGERFDVVYQIMNEVNHGWKELEREIEAMVLSKRTTTVADEEYQEIICGQLTDIVADQINRYERQLKLAKGFQQQALFIKILQQLLLKLREYNFQINDEKYLFLTARIIEKMSDLQEGKMTGLKKENQQLAKALELKSKEVKELNSELEEIRNKKVETATVLDVIKEETEEKEQVKSELLVQANKLKQSGAVTLKDFKEPLQVISANPNTSATLKTGKAPFAKVKTKQNGKRHELENKISLKNLKIK